MTDSEKVKKIIEELLGKLGVKYEGLETVVSKTTASPKFLVRSSESAILIGVKGANLQAFNHLVKKIVGKGKETDEETRFFIDVNDYHEKMEEELKNKAKIMSERARSFKVDVELEPMTSYERMVVHSFLQDLKDIKTESKGEGRKRRVVIKYLEPGL
jgi:spoIIIJ-associated protein